MRKQLAVALALLALSATACTSSGSLPPVQKFDHVTCSSVTQDVCRAL